MSEAQVVEYCPCCGGVDSVLFRVCRCDGSEPTNAELMAELKAVRESLTPVDLVTGFADVQPGEAVYPAAGDTVELAEPWEPVGKENPSFMPLTSRAGLAISKALGIDASTTVKVSLTFGAPGETFVTATFPVSDDDMASVMGALREVRVRPEPIGFDELGCPIFAEAPSPAAARSPVAGRADAVPASSPHPSRL